MDWVNVKWETRETRLTNERVMGNTAHYIEFLHWTVGLGVQPWTALVVQAYLDHCNIRYSMEFTNLGQLAQTWNEYIERKSFSIYKHIDKDHVRTGSREGEADG